MKLQRFKTAIMHILFTILQRVKYVHCEVWTAGRLKIFSSVNREFPWHSSHCECFIQ